MGPSYRHGMQDAQWVDLVEENINGHVKKHYIYGELESQTLDFTTRADISFTPTLSLQFYVQPFVTIGDYTSFKEACGTEVISVQAISSEGKPGLPSALFAGQRRSPLGVPTWKHAVFGLVPIAGGGSNACGRSRP